MKCFIKNAEGKKLIPVFLEHAMHLHMYQSYKGVEFCTESSSLPTAQTFSRLTSPEVELTREQETMTYGVWIRQTGEAALTKAED